MRNLERNVERVCRVVTDRQADRRQTDRRQTDKRQTDKRQADKRQADRRQAPPLAYTPCQRFKASCASYADGSLRLLCAPECISGFHTAGGQSQSSLMVWHLTT